MWKNAECNILYGRQLPTKRECMDNNLNYLSLQLSFDFADKHPPLMKNAIESVLLFP